MPRATLQVLALCVIASVPLTGARAANRELAADNTAWNGLSGLLEEAARAGVAVEAPDELSLDALGPNDGLLVVHPRRPLPRAALIAFMDAGGRLAVADDFGASDALLSAFRIGRHAPVPPPPERRLRGNRNVLIAKPALSHPLSREVRALVTNHTQVLHHADLSAVFALDRGKGAVVLTGAVGEGRLVAIGDSSVLMNNMLEFRGNRRFAQNLVRYLAGDGRLFVVTPDTPMRGSFGGIHSDDRLAGMRVGLEQLADIELPPMAIALTAAVVALALLLAAVRELPRRHAHATPAFLDAGRVAAGVGGRVAFFGAPGRNLLAPTLSFKAELEERLLSRLALGQQPQLSELLNRMRERGLSAAVVDETRELLLALDKLQMEQQRHGPPPRVGRRKFHALVASGERILDAIEPAEDGG